MVTAAVGATSKTFFASFEPTNRPPRLAHRSAPRTTPSAAVTPTVVVPVVNSVVPPVVCSVGRVESMVRASGGLEIYVS
jgi:hypothetical protein